ncbi:MAG TPA: flagellar basal body L-ring protein FlgH [Sedimentisphaerales bacterium]|nr:flagellar basal body L-ring protein FlgH [Sedimentisphaerales bacterium]
MKNRTALLCMSMFFLLSWAACARAGSIWAKKNKNMRDYYADDVARKIGDVLTIKISEDSKVDNKAKRDLKKETDRSAAFNGELGIVTSNKNLLPRIPGFSMDAESTNELKSKADYKDERKFVDSITVVVVDVLPNGNLVVAGTRNREIAGDIQNIEVSGIVRPSDIAFDNTVESKRVADFRIVTRNKGVAAPYTRPGWLGTIFDILWPW